jgi:hypothetical protein
MGNLIHTIKTMGKWTYSSFNKTPCPGANMK